VKEESNDVYMDNREGLELTITT